MPLGTEVGLNPGDIVLQGTQLSNGKVHSPLPHFSAHVYCGQTVAYISATTELLFQIRVGPQIFEDFRTGPEAASRSGEIVQPGPNDIG